MLFRHAVLVLLAMLACGTCMAQRVEMVIGGMTQTDAAVDDSCALVIELNGRSIQRQHARDALAQVLAWSPLIDAAAERFGIDRALLMAVMDVESGGNALAVFPKGAQGLMQLMPATGAMQGATDLLDPAQNVLAGARLLDSLLATYGEVGLALAAYNAGEGAVKKYGGTIPPYAETQRYVQLVLQRLTYYQQHARKKSPV